MIYQLGIEAALGLIVAVISSTRLLCLLLWGALILVVIGLLYMANPDSCRHESTFLACRGQGPVGRMHLPRADSA